MFIKSKSKNPKSIKKSVFSSFKNVFFQGSSKDSRFKVKRHTASELRKIQQKKTSPINQKIFVSQPAQNSHKIIRWQKNSKVRSQIQKRQFGYWFYYFKKVFQLNFWKDLFGKFLIILRWKSWQNLIFGYLVIFSIVGSFLYISLWDRFFLIRDFEIVFNSQEYPSYLSEEEVQKLVKKWQESKIYGIFPNNQYWFANQESLFNTANSLYPNITNIKILQKKWPDKLKVEITTAPILLTLKIQTNNSTYYLRVAESGKVVNIDKAGLKENLVNVDLKIANISENKIKNLDFSQNNQVYNRLWFTKKIIDWSNSKNSYLKLAGIEYPTPIDNDVVLILYNGARLILDSQSITWENQVRRLNFFLTNPDWSLALQNQKIRYVDFRINRKIFICYYGKGC
jgi:hypothetical protein